MSGAAFILLINLLVAGLFCASFVLIAVYDRTYRSARWFAGAYATGMAYALIEFLIPAFTDVRVAVFLGHATFLVTLLMLNIGLARRYEVATPRILLTAVFAVSLVVSALLQDMPRASFLRMLLYQAPYFAMQAVGAAIVLRAGGRRPVDNLLAGFLGLSALHYLSKPFIAMAVGGAGAGPQDYLATTYAMVSQSMGTVLVVATALLLLAMLAVDIVRDITARSETDLLSGLLNRRGFEERLDQTVRRRANGLPVSLVICDLDHFKRVNDTYGHAAGDRLIALFAATLRDGAAGHHVLGRIGGEEFAAVLPGSNLASGRLFAETVRTAFAGHEIDGFPSGTGFTASFGVAELKAGETAASLMARADAALYEAKRAGRDCVRVSPHRQTVHDGRAASRGDQRPATISGLTSPYLASSSLERR